MSVINQMLKDLDKRRQPHSLSAMPNVLPNAMQESRPSRIRLLWWLLPAALLMAAWQLWSGATKVPVAAPAPEHVAAAQNQVASVEPAVAEAQAPTSDAVDEPVTTSPATAPAALIATPALAKSDEPHSGEQQAKTKPVAEPLTKALPVELDDTRQSAPSPAIADSGSIAITEVKFSPEELAQKSYMEALAAQDQGQVAEAERDYRRALAQNSAHHEARTALAALHFGRSQLAQAIKLLDAGIGQFPEITEFRLLLAKVQMAQGQEAAARLTLDAIADSDSLALDKWLQLAELARRQDDQRLAEQAYAALTALQPNEGRWWLGLAYAQDAQGQYVQAVTAYRRALGLDGLSRDARDFMEHRLMQLGESR
ncbi:tetratricopeptide repeat protein [Shewanella cyperi]|uniref:tetratricopeptide repeat protein n=1 Tax=Shewanella cyperi TaxID=2814292 RepID=UPI001A949022|nr:tetratricopeptide repeat protein [Shewanella cyperi]QSX40466.1 tetratricopeptide repeat protein [Shewanella cyperi]